MVFVMFITTVIMKSLQYEHKYKYASFYEHSIHEFLFQGGMLIFTYFSLHKLYFR
jgi:hypothetical protein